MTKLSLFERLSVVATASAPKFDLPFHPSPCKRTSVFALQRIQSRALNFYFKRDRMNGADLLFHSLTNRYF